MEDRSVKELAPMKVLPEPTLRRLPLYYQYLKKLEQSATLSHVSATRIGADLSILPIQVRKDLEVTHAAGMPKRGYKIAELIRTIEDFLGWNSTMDAFLVGVGHLGAALLGYEGFKEYGFNIVAGFDVAPDKVGTEISGKKILHTDKLVQLSRRMGIRIGILAVPARAAEEVADAMVKAGMLAIWNFSPVRIHVPEGVIVQHENLASSLVVLSKKLAVALNVHTRAR